jgi:3-oxoacyl-[acyl-carrier-protein] synthase I
LQPLAITAYSAVNCLGEGNGATLAALHEMRSGLAPCAFEAARLDVYVGEIPAATLAPVNSALAAYDCRNNRIAQLALRQEGFETAVQRAAARYGASRIAVVLGTSTSGILNTEQAYRMRDRDGALPRAFQYATTHNTYSLAAFTQRYLDLKGPSVAISTACSSSAKVFASASRMIAAGLCDAAVVGGADSLCFTTLYGFHSLQLLSRSRCRPFDAERDGISIGEGGGFALLERAQGAPPGTLALLGVGESSDAHHMSSPHPDGHGARLSMEGALRSAGLQPGDIDYINLHGTGTRSNDSSEGKAVRALFGRQTPASSTKGWFGHTLGACGIQEAIVCFLALEHGFIPGSANTRCLDPEIDIDYAIENRALAVRHALSNSFGFGGTNCTLIFGRLP